jgi:hypothetical protein
MKAGRPNKYDCPAKPKSICSVCETYVSPRRAVTLTYPTLTLCPSCHTKNLDNMLALSEKYDDGSVTFYITVRK